MKKLTLILTVLISCAVVLASCGVSSDAAYVNENFGIGFAPAEGLVMSDEAEIAAYAGEGVECEMIATDTETGSAVVVSVETAMVEDAALYLETVKSALSIDGFEIAFGEIETVEIAGEEFAALTYSVSSSGINTSMATCVRIEGDEMFIINASYGNEAQLEGFLDCFVAVG